MKTQRTNPTRFGAAALAMVVSLALAVSASAQSSMIWSISADGAKEVTAGGVPNQGDPDGFAFGTFELNNGTGGNTGFAVINLTLGNLAYPLTAWHVHVGAATTTGGPVIDLGNPETLRTGDILSGTVLNLSSTAIDAVFANPSGYYLNIHNGSFPAGAVRDQLTVLVPEPSSLALAAIGLIALAVRQSRKPSVAR